MFLLKSEVIKKAQKVTIYFGYFLSKFESKKFLKVVQSDHTGSSDEMTKK